MAALDFPASPTTNQQYTGPGGVIWTWDSAKWTNATPSLLSSALNDVGRNLLHNSMFNIAQRGVGPFTTNVYTLDRWAVAFVSDAVSIVQFAINDADRTQIGDEAAIWLLGNTFTGNAAAGAFNVIYQRIEGVRRLAGKTVTVSFYARAGATTKLGVGLDQGFGTGGSPSAAVYGAGQSVTLSTAWARYTLNFTLPSASGKTTGSNNDDSTTVNFWYSSGATQAARAGNVGVQSGSVNIWGVQLEIGSVATPLEKLDPTLQLQQCQRFYQTVFAQLGTYSTAGSGFGYAVSLPVTMRAWPGTPVIAGAGYINASGIAAQAQTAREIYVYAIATATGPCQLYGTILASADL